MIIYKSLKKKIRKSIKKKSMKGGKYKYTDVTYLGQGADNFVFKINGSDRILRILKNCSKSTSTEYDINKKLIEKPIKNFVKIYEQGMCKDLKTGITSELKNFCDPELNDDSTSCNYQYLIQEYIKGDNILVDFIKKFKDSTTDPEEDIKINTYVDNLLHIFYNIYNSLILADNELNGFTHNDLNYRNVIICGNKPTIFDFGGSTFNTGKQQDIKQKVDGLDNFIKQSIGDNEIDDTILIQVFGDEWKNKSPSDKKTIFDNLYRIRNLIRQKPKIEKIITEYYNSREKDNKTLLALKDEFKIGTTLNEVSTFLGGLIKQTGGKLKIIRKSVIKNK